MTRTLLIYLLSLLIVSGIGACGSSADKSPDDNQQATEKVAEPVDSLKTILFFGNSLTAGYGLDPVEAFPALIQLKIDSLKLPYKVINGGLSGETTSGGKTRIDWLLRQKIDVFILELGANDGLRGIPVKETKQNLQAIIDQVKSKYPEVKLVLAGMHVPPNMGAAYAKEFHAIYSDIAKKNEMTLIPFLLEGVGGNPELNQGDGIHPTAEGHKIVADEVWKYLQPIL
ncbi:arylesterase [Flavihumibacter sp. ZG627]|uniref:arylesterase n=1 Tax=Flavihumibacter sp. ZG627 TaxID=1463156 RepID=UPI00057EF53B|nr:arylesterase [Flavihumibacter sp. ZG627]KIC91362.1 GDSL family lipase [Flavihumibacter sp. ZG627]